MIGIWKEQAVQFSINVAMALGETITHNADYQYHQSSGVWWEFRLPRYSARFFVVVPYDGLCARVLLLSHEGDGVSMMRVIGGVKTSFELVNAQHLVRAIATRLLSQDDAA